MYYKTAGKPGLEEKLNYVDCIKFKCLDWHNFFIFLDILAPCEGFISKRLQEARRVY